MRDYRLSVLMFLSLSVIAFCINLLLADVSGNTVNMFYVGPLNSPLAVFKQIAEAAGWYVCTFLYLPALCIGAFLVFLPRYLWERRAARRNKS